LIGNKCDKLKERVISYEEGLDFALNKSMKFLETSAKDYLNLEKMLEIVTREYLTEIPRRMTQYKSIKIEKKFDNHHERRQNENKKCCK
jgi:uncharacterized membrane-anchored protein YhcB (DUF1043 family)